MVLLALSKSRICIVLYCNIFKNPFNTQFNPRCTIERVAVNIVLMQEVYGYCVLDFSCKLIIKLLYCIYALKIK